AMIFDDEGRLAAQAQQELTQHFPAPGWDEHDQEEIWAAVLATARGAMEAARLGAHEIAAICITNQRETTLLCELA
ncbi:FGGY family carbohydrate kinase, partial [Salmonella enterica]|uniref:FGGY family carbohydrate kinase n=1 Tax=Salmonella enterica TaxID=28901 RepID=UPI003298198D